MIRIELRSNKALKAGKMFKNVFKRACDFVMHDAVCAYDHVAKYAALIPSPRSANLKFISVMTTKKMHLLTRPLALI